MTNSLFTIICVIIPVSATSLTTDAELRAEITKSMFGSLKAILDYDSTPGEGVGTTDTKYILGVGWNF